MRLISMAAVTMALLLIACSGPARPTPGVAEPSGTAAPQYRQVGGNTLVETHEYTGIIFSEKGAPKFRDMFDGSATEYWEPSVDDIVRAEDSISQFLVALQNDLEDDEYPQHHLAFILDNLEKYKRQYVGLVVDGEKRIGCNMFYSDDSFPDDSSSDWQRVPVFVLDGGNYYWQIEYDLLKDECFNFYIHGEA